MALLEKIRTLCEQVNPAYHFEFENDWMMNVKADDAHFPLVYFEEYTDGRFNVGYGLKKSVMVELHLFRLVPMHCSAVEREQAREQIEEEFVLPFIEAINASGDFEQIEEFTCLPEPTMFDANATGVLLRFWVTYRVC